MESRQTYRDKAFALADRTLRGPGRPLVQTGADDIASHLRPDGRNLVLWPEDMGLWAAFTGERGRAARGSGSLVGAVAGLYTSYAPQAVYYGQRFPAVSARVPQIRLLALALTDTFARTAVETFSEMAAKYGVWLEVGVNMTQDWKVVCAGGAHPPQEECAEEDPARVQMLRDPDEPSRGYAYEATSRDVSNMALVFDPSGKLVSKQVKNYVTPIEVGRAEGQVAALDLVPGSITGGLSAVATPVGTLGFVTSKDAWMPDVVDRLEAAGVDLLIQPEFFVGDLAAPTGMWAADTLKASGYADVLRHPGFNAMVLPSAVGNVFDFSADQQSHIVEQPTKAGRGRWLIGQPRAPGLTAVTPWVVEDPKKGESLAERRKRLGEVGVKLAPGSGVECPDPAKPGVCENGHVETVLWRDVKVGPREYARYDGRKIRRRFTGARPMARQPRVERNAAVAAAGRWVAVAFEQRRAEGDRVMVAVSRDRGRHWGRATDVMPALAGDQRWPAVTIGRDGKMTVAWTNTPPARSAQTTGERVLAGSSETLPRVLFAQGRLDRLGAPTFVAPSPIDPSAPTETVQWKPALARGSDGTIHAAFIDARTRFSDAPLPQAGVYYTRIANGAAEPARRIDGGRPAPLAAKLDNAWAPAIAVRGPSVLVTWIDFMHYDWDVLSRLSTDGGRTFERQVNSNLEPEDVESLSDSPKPVFTTGGPFIAWTDFHKRESVKAAHPLYDTYLARPGAEPVQADPHGGRHVSTFWPSVCASGGDVLVAFQDSSAGVPHVRVARVRRGTRRGHAFVVNDTRAPAQRPAIACAGGRVIAAWEDSRTGMPRIYAASASTRRIR